MEICGIRIQSSFSTSEFDELTKKIKLKHTIIGFIDGHNCNGKIKNPIWIISENYKLFLFILCGEKQIITKLCAESYRKIIDFEISINRLKKITWNVSTNGYICGSSLQFHTLGIHQVIMNLYRHNNYNLSVDHIDRDPLNNIFENLRVATREEQEQNSKGIMKDTKRARKSSAKPLPPGITQDMMKKYVVYYHEWLDKEQTRSREFFKIEKHPKLDKIWTGTKSNQISIQEKLKQINKIADDLENDIFPAKAT